MEWLPQALKIGMSEEMFWHSNPRKIKPYIKAYEERRKDDMRNANVVAYIQARYFCDSLACTVGNMFGGKHEFPEEPYDFLGEKKQQELSEEEKAAQVKLFFAELETMKRNFELEKQG